MFNDKKIRIAILDLNENLPNQGMRCIRQILKEYGEKNNIEIEHREFEVRVEKQVPDLSFDIYISSGGPEAHWKARAANGKKIILTGFLRLKSGTKILLNKIKNMSSLFATLINWHAGIIKLPM